jgi:hypothetical protein
LEEGDHQEPLDVDFIILVQDKKKWWDFVNTVMNLRVP